MAVQDPNAHINKRIDEALERGRQSEAVVIGLSVMIFLLGAGLVVVAVATGSPVYAVPALVIEGFLYWPIRQILRLRKQNIALATAPALINTLPPAQAAAEMVKLLEEIRRA